MSEKMESKVIQNPFPHIVIDGFIEYAKEIQEEILNLPNDKFDSLNNLFEKKKLLNGLFLRSILADDKTSFKYISKIFGYFESKEFVSQLEKIFGIEHLIVDPTRYYYGIHKMDENGDKLDIHIDSNIHPTLKLKKRLTVLLYLTKDLDSKEGKLELWNGEDSGIYTKEKTLPKLKEKVKEYSCDFNRLVVFDGASNSYHGQPQEIKNIGKGKRLLITLSYLSNDDIKGDTRSKALFLKLPNEIDSKEKEELRFKRASIDWIHSREKM